jgi:hypothetical protein
MGYKSDRSVSSIHLLQKDGGSYYLVILAFDTGFQGGATVKKFQNDKSAVCFRKHAIFAGRALTATTRVCQPLIGAVPFIKWNTCQIFKSGCFTAAPAISE